MLTIGLLREGKIPLDTRVAFTPHQCLWLEENKEVKVVVQPSPNRCFEDREYAVLGIEVREDLSDCDILLGIKEVPEPMLIPEKVYLFFSHTKKLQPYNQGLFQAILRKKITLIDYECLTYEDGSRVLGFGFFAGIVGAHNGILAYCNRFGLPSLPRVFETRDLNALAQIYASFQVPPCRIAVTGSGRVAKGIIKVLELLGIPEVTPEEFVRASAAEGPVFTNLYGNALYANIENGQFNREEFHSRPENYRCLFHRYLKVTDVLMNGIYWNENIPRLFEMEDMQKNDFHIQTIADVTDDLYGSVPCNLGDATIEDPVYGVDRFSGRLTPPYLKTGVDVMAVGNLPNELPVDASKYFGEHLIKHVVDDLLSAGSPMLDRATIVRKGKITGPYSFMQDYGSEKVTI